MGQQSNGRLWERTYNVNLDLATKKTLLLCMDQERHYHNTLVGELNSKMRVMCREIAAIKDQQEKLFAAVAQSGIRPSTLLNKPAEQWPELLAPFRDMLVKDGKPQLSDKVMLVMDIPAAEARLHPLMRRAMALEILRWVQPQARIMVNSLGNTGGQMSGPLQMLQPLDVGNKRHVQILGNLTSMTYDDLQRETRIDIPYSSNSIVIKNQDLTKSPHDHIIIRPSVKGDRIDPNQWSITVMAGNGRYLIDHLDVTYQKRRRR